MLDLTSHTEAQQMKIDADIHNLAKWLNEEQTAPIDRQALARLLAWAQIADKPAAWVYPEFFEGITKAGCWTAYAGDGVGQHPDGVQRFPLYRGPQTGGDERRHIICLCPDCTQPAQQDHNSETIVQTFTGVPMRKLRELLAAGWQVNGVCFQRIEEDGTVRRGAVTAGGMVLWWNQPAQQEPVHPETLREIFQKYGTGRLDGFTAAVKEAIALTRPQAREPLTENDVKAICYVGPVYAPDGMVTRTPQQYRQELEAARLHGIRRAEAAHDIKGDA
ncbi:hypothetical protein [Limnohabitans sp.]